MPTRDPLVQRPKEKQKRRGRRSTVMQDPDTIESVCLAQIGKGNNLLRTKYHINFSDGQFQYRLSKAKVAAGMEKGDGFRKAWREGRSEYEDIAEALLPELKKHYVRDILPHIEHPLLQAAPAHLHKGDAAPTVDEAVRELKKKKVGLV